MRVGRRVLGSVFVIAGVAVGCGGPSPSGSPVSSAAPSTTSPASAASAASATPRPSDASGPSAGVVIVDATLLDILPASIDGIALVADDETAAGIAASGGLADSVVSIAVGLYAGVGPSPEEDLAIANMVTLPDGAFDDAFFRTWRATYDAAACEPAGGVAVGAAEAEIDGRTVFIGTCVNGGHTYHVHLDDPERLLAMTAFGDDRLGEQVVAGLTE